MQLPAASILAFTALLYLTSAHKFIETCGSCYFEHTGFSCECGNGRTYQDLNPYLGNDGGHLVWGSRRVWLEFGGGGGGYPATYIDLNPYISNINNQLHVD